ncbi:MAG: carboxylesterase/lipase family protein [Xanthomonadales bacterium]|nr:carboxylesterase family protein [Gammaproteobacteria bacterium]NND57277.1 carboxylesterase/lipase family protein [Xanthomonadales bacterium]NNK51617.1 carboxylesterase/lipase family protein [Xanthomonadales bacterium]
MRIFVFLAAALLTPLALAAKDPVSVTGGAVQGTLAEDLGIRIYRGIPFAAPPVGEQRWRDPQPVTPWQGVRKADTWGDRCMQGEMFGGPLVSREQTMSEDCLYLNVWTPAKAATERLPVLMVFHGGGFAAGSGSEPRTDGEWFAQQGIVVVEPNYRLGLFGFMAHPELTAESQGRGSGNYGLLDQVAALRWVQDNIAVFGGDPDNVTINGESAGSLSVSALMASPLSKHMVHKAIGQSGAFFPEPTGGIELKPLAEKEQDGIRFAVSMGAESLTDLRAIPADKLLAAVMKTGGWGYGPGLDNHFMPQAVSAVFMAGQQANIPLLAGWNSAELGMSVALNPNKPTPSSFNENLQKQFGERAPDALAVYPASNDEETMQSAADLASDLFISYATWKWIETHAKTAQAPVYRYRFDRTLPGDPASRFGALHAVEIEYAFNTLDSKQAEWQPADHEVAEVMAAAFANFVKTGDPNGPAVPAWPEFGKTRQVMYLDAASKSAAERHRERYEFIDSVVWQ